MPASDDHTSNPFDEIIQNLKASAILSAVEERARSVESGQTTFEISAKY